MSPQYNSIRMKKYKSKLGLSKYKAGTPIVNSFTHAQHYIQNSRFNEKENYSTLK